jgi:hypothetical protein
VLILATDEPIDAAAPDHATRLVRRVKQGIAEYFRYNLKTQMWERLPGSRGGTRSRAGGES